jgi:DNA-binding beta-propeller fold protein YncE
LSRFAAAGFATPVGALFDGTNIWVTDFAANDLKKLDSNGNILQSVPCGTGPQLPVYDGANIWVPSYYSNSVTVVRARDGLVLATLTGNGLNGATQAAFDGERILVTNLLGHSLSLWKAADLTEIASTALGFGVSPYGVCSDGIGFLITMSNYSVVVPF